MDAVNFLWIVGVLGILIIGLPAFGIFKDLRFFFRYRLREKWGWYLPLERVFLDPIEQFLPYYQKLSTRDRQRFHHRVRLFIRAKQFIPRGDLRQVTPEMIGLISGIAVMLTMGLPLITFPSFKRILIYPTDYYNKINRAYHKGEVNLRHGLIILSWEHFVKGVANTRDGINLGIHELAHALHFEDRMVNREYNYLHASLLNYWSEHARAERAKIESGQDHLFRPYAATNDEEFFAIAVENFFERPQEFQDDLPKLYHILSNLLKQDPITGRIGEER